MKILFLSSSWCPTWFIFLSETSRTFVDNYYCIVHFLHFSFLGLVIHIHHMAYANLYKWTPHVYHINYIDDATRYNPTRNQ